MEDENIPFYDPEYTHMKNPNLYVTLASSGGLWSASVYPWQESFPWTFNQAY